MAGLYATQYVQITPSHEKREPPNPVSAVPSPPQDASTVDAPRAIASQNRTRCSRRPAGGRPLPRAPAAVARTNAAFLLGIATPHRPALRQPVESTRSGACPPAAEQAAAAPRHLYEDTASAWTARHRAWLTTIDLGAGGAQATLLDYLGAVDTLVIRRDILESTISELVPGSPWAQTVARLRCLRRIDTLSAVGLCAEVGDFARFDRPGRLMSYLGLVPSENSSGDTRRQGAICRTALSKAIYPGARMAVRVRAGPPTNRRSCRRQRSDVLSRP